MARLSHLLALPHLGLRLIQSGPSDPDLSWVSTTELLDLGDYLEGGEIVLTTGLALQGEDARWRDFVAGLSRARVAAIGFGVGVTHERIPRTLVSAASTYRVALVEVPPPTPFIAVSKAVAELLQADELRAARGALRTHQRLLDGAAGPQNTAEVLASIAQATGRQLALVSGARERIASTAGFDSADAAAPADTEAIPLDDAGTTRLLLASGDPVGPEGRAVLAAGAMVLGLEIRGARSEDERERARWARLTDALLDDRLPPEAVAVLDRGLELPQRIRAVAVQGTAEAVAAWRRDPRSGFERLVTAGESVARAPGVALAWHLCPDTADALDHAVSRASRHGLDAVVGRPTPAYRAGVSRRSAAARLGALSPVSALYAEPRTPRVLWVDRDLPLLDALISATTDPVGAGRFGTGRTSGTGRTGDTDNTDDTGDTGDTGAARRSSATLSAAVLGPLSAFDSPVPHGGAELPSLPGSRHANDAVDPPVNASEQVILRATLRALLEHLGQRGPAAAALGVHRNTLRDRLARIERLTGRSVDDPDQRAELWLALRLEESTLDSASTAISTAGTVRSPGRRSHLP